MRLRMSAFLLPPGARGARAGGCGLRWMGDGAPPPAACTASDGGEGSTSSRKAKGVLEQEGGAECALPRLW